MALCGAVLLAGCAKQAAPVAIVDPYVDPYAGAAVNAGPATIMADGTSCPYGYMVKPGDANDCTLAPGFAPVSVQGSGVQGAVEDQTRALQQIQRDQVNADLAQRREADSGR